MNAAELHRKATARSLRLTGYPATHFAALRIARVRGLVDACGITVGAVLDAGCGTGDSLAPLRTEFPGARILAYEPAAVLHEAARAAAADAGAELVEGDSLTLEGAVDVVYCSGLFRRIPRPDRISTIARLAHALRPGGLACVWENAPLNPGTRLVMARIPMERTSVVMGPRELEVLQLSAGLKHLVTEYHFVFPRAFAALRPLEDHLRRLPLGGQYLVAGRRG